MQGSEGEAKIDGVAGEVDESDERKAGAGAAAQPARGAPQFRLSPRTMALTLLALVALVVGSWFLFGKLRTSQAPDTESAAATRAEPENAAPADSPENLDQLTAARAAHEAIMSSETAPLVGAGLFSAPVSVTPTPGAGPESTAPAPSPATTPTPPTAPPAVPPATAPAAAAPAPAPAKDPAARRPAVRPLSPSPAPAAPAAPPDPDKPTPSVANDPQALGPGGCTLGDGRSLGQNLGRCLEEYNEIDRELRRTGRVVRRHHG